MNHQKISDSERERRQKQSEQSRRGEDARDFQLLILDYDDLRKKGIRFSRQWLRKLIAAGKFPKPINMGAQSIGWVSTEIDAWIGARIQARDGEAA